MEDHPCGRRRENGRETVNGVGIGEEGSVCPWIDFEGRGQGFWIAVFMVEKKNKSKCQQ